MQPAFPSNDSESSGEAPHGHENNNQAPQHSTFGDLNSFGVQPPAPSPATASPEPAPVAAQPTAGLGELANGQPVPVVKTLSVRGVEYFMMAISLWITAAGLIWLMLSAVSGEAEFDTLVYPASFLVVTLPIFGFFYLRLRKAELERPELRFDPSKRRFSQLTQMLAFIVCLANTITFVYQVMSKIAGDSEASLGKSFLNLLLVLLIAGGVLVYYWIDEHRDFNRG